MAQLDPNVVYCARHGFVPITESAEVIPGKWVNVCSLCHKAAQR